LADAIKLRKDDKTAFKLDRDNSNKFYSVFSGEYEGHTFVHIVLLTKDYDFDLLVRLYTKNLVAEVGTDGLTSRLRESQIPYKGGSLTKFKTTCQLS
jgi:hypothetical protein